MGDDRANMTTTEASAPVPLVPLYSDERIRQLFNKRPWSLLLVSDMRDNYERNRNFWANERNSLHEAIGKYAIDAIGDGWRIATLERELQLIREKLKDQPPVYDELDRWLYGEKEDDNE